MPIEQKLIPAEPDSPTRCQASGDAGEGQCKFESLPGHQRCAKHGGVMLEKVAEKARVHDYRLQLWQKRLDEFTETDQVKNLRGEIGVLRLLIENILNLCSDQQQLMLFSGRISDLIVKLEKCVSSCDRLEGKMGMLLDKASALILAQRVVEVIGKHVHDPQVIDSISAGIIDILASLGSKEVE